ncbi:MAG: hypothetical protein A3K19_16275 [Lentisphaerae bacterium RIFOXYB12_FULL_65_16]|nr:MAG: hypothetical protein A3K18_20580 [Lentisphaerae bacterium RIFOXYA12_64_32]OGV84491.1 MAG: hypothetical protein A3K19_16275 [Lentisphaerae bacterium RIFOXYB12_FULL_65_16]
MHAIGRTGRLGFCVSRSLTILVLLCLGARSAPETALPAGLADPSFETEPGATPSEWVLSLESGAEGAVSWATEAHTGRRALRIEKTNGLGYIMLSTARPLPAKPGVEYESALYYRLQQSGFSSRVYFCNMDIGADGKELFPVHYSPDYVRIPSFAKGDEWQRHGCKWTVDSRAAATRLRFLLLGDPGSLVIDDVEFVEAPKPVVHPGQSDSGEKPFDEAAARAILASRQPLPARVETQDNRPVFVVGDRIRTTLVHQAAYGSAAASRYGGFGRSGVHLHTVTVQMGPLSEKRGVAWKYPNGFDFKDLEQDILRVVGADPDGWVILQTRCDLPRQWGIDHPDDIWAEESGQKSIVPKGDCHPCKIGTTLAEGDYFVGSYGSPAYRQDMSNAVAELGKFVRTSDVGKVVVGFIIGGGNDGQFFDWSPNWQAHLDQSPGHRRGFQEWLREVYGNDVAALRQAWGDPAVTFETATVPAEKERTVDAPFLQTTGPQRRVADANRFSSLAPVRLAKALATTMKETIGRPVFSMIYYPDAIHDGGSNRYALTELLAEPGRFDSVVAVQEYGQWRQLGGTGCTNASWGVHRLRGTAQLCEIDYRTFRCYAGGDWGMDTLGAPDTAEGFRAQIRRDLGATATRGMGAWYYDMGGGWYDDPTLWSVVEESNRILAWTSRNDAPSPVAQLAVFVDEAAGWRVSRGAVDVIWNAVPPQRLALNLSGVPYDVYYLDDIRNPRLPDYKAYIFLSAFTLNREQMTAIKSRCRQPDAILAFPGTPGLGSADFADVPALVQELTDIRCEWLPEGSSTACIPLPGCTDPIAEGLTGAFVHEGRAGKYTLVPADPTATAFGTFVAQNRTSHAIKRTPQATTLQFVGGLTPQLVHNIATEAGIRTLGTPGQVIYVGSGVAVCHRIRPGPATVTFEHPVDLIDLDGKTVLARHVTEWNPDCAMLDTAVVFYRPAHGLFRRLFGGR